MTPALRRYIAIEAGIGALINGVLSLAFVWLIFGGVARVPIFGAHGLIVDAVPQSFMIALMSTIVPTLLTRKRVRRGVVGSPAAVVSHQWHKAVLRAVWLIAVGAAAGIVVSAATLAVGPAHWPFAAAAIGKTLYGALLGAAMSAIATRTALLHPIG